jgi:serine protein kinase
MRDQPRYVQDKISNALVSPRPIEEHTVNPFMVINELEGGLSHHSLITDEELKKRYKELLSIVKDEYEDIIKGEVQRAISADEDAIKRLCANYIENVRAYTQKEKVVNKYTGKDEEPDERLMRSIEEKIDIPENRKDDFRQEIMNYIGALALDGKKFEYNTNARLYKALELKLFEDSARHDQAQEPGLERRRRRDPAEDRRRQAAADQAVRVQRASATDVLNYVASIFARGDLDF